jgi:uncharacterized protein
MGAIAEAPAGDKMHAPPQACSAVSVEEYGRGRNPVLDFYQQVLSPAKGGNTCAMHPSCSQYAKILFDRFPFPIAYALTCARLIRCGQDPELYPVAEVQGLLRSYDPVPLP